jgi:hypothetical protein
VEFIHPNKKETEMADDVLPYNDDRRPMKPARGPYEAPHWLTDLGRTERGLEQAHAVQIRSATREIEVVQAREAVDLTRSMARLDSTARYATEVKFRLDRARRESRILAEDDPVLGQQFDIVDNLLFQHGRNEMTRRLK